nr:NAD(P)-dependent oxidoreductase [Bifidobacterium bifidum]
AILRATKDVKWTYVSPAADFQADGQKIGKYLLGGEEFMLNDRQQSVISYADYAVAMIDEIEKGNHVQQRISVVEA